MTRAKVQGLDVSKKKRVTIMLPRDYDFLLEQLAAGLSKEKNQLVSEALIDLFLKHKEKLLAVHAQTSQSLAEIMNSPT